MRRINWITFVCCLMSLQCTRLAHAHGGHAGGGHSAAAPAHHAADAGPAAPAHHAVDTGGAAVHSGHVHHTDSSSGSAQPAGTAAPAAPASLHGVTYSFGSPAPVTHHHHGAGAVGHSFGTQSTEFARPAGGGTIMVPAGSAPGNMPVGTTHQGTFHHGTGHHGAGHHGTGFQGTSTAGIYHQGPSDNRVHFASHSIALSHIGYQPAYSRHAGVYHGHWNRQQGIVGGYSTFGLNGYNGGSGFGFGYSGDPYFWGLGGWGLGALNYTSGYTGYTNPYYDPAYSNFNYSTPIPVGYNPSLVTSTPKSTNNDIPADTILNAAVASFKQNNYDDALNLVNSGVVRYPDDAVMHEFRSLVLFAKGDYQQSASTIHAVLAVGPGWDWSTLIGLYTNPDVYTSQLRTLESYVKQNQNDGFSRFLLAYHYLTCGFPDAAQRQLKQVNALVPHDKVAVALMRMISARQPAASTNPNAGLPNPEPQPPVDLPGPSQKVVAPIHWPTLLGQWKSTRDDGSIFWLKLRTDFTFTWTFVPKGQHPINFGGTYSLDGNLIAMERAGGGSMVAEITQIDRSTFQFKMVGSSSEDPGLTFVK